MARTEADLTYFTFASDYNPAHYNWTEKELAALGNGCKSIAEVVKKRLEDNGAKVKEMYVIEHRGEAKATKEFHSYIDETKLHYHILVYFEPSHKTPLTKIAKYVGIPPEVIDKPKQGYRFDNALSYLVHIKDKEKISYKPIDVVTLAGTDYIDYYNERKMIWEKGGKYKAEKGRKTINRLFREAMTKLDEGTIKYDELRGVREYRKLLKTPTYARQLKQKGQCMADLAKQDYLALRTKIQQKEITSLDEIIATEEGELAYKYHKDDIDFYLKKAQGE